MISQVATDYPKGLRAVCWKFKKNGANKIKQVPKLGGSWLGFCSCDDRFYKKLRLSESVINQLTE